MNEELRAKYDRWEQIEAGCCEYHCLQCSNVFFTLQRWWKHQQKVHQNKHSAGSPPKMVCAVIEMDGRTFGFNLGLIGYPTLVSRLMTEFRLADQLDLKAPDQIDLMWGEPLRVVPVSKENPIVYPTTISPEAYQKCQELLDLHEISIDELATQIGVNVKLLLRARRQESLGYQDVKRIDQGIHVAHYFYLKGKQDGA
jgi:hypothetical protein